MMSLKTLAAATTLVRALAATIARQRNLITGFQTLTAEAETSASEQDDQLALLRPAAESVWLLALIMNQS